MSACAAISISTDEGQLCDAEAAAAAAAMFVGKIKNSPYTSSHSKNDEIENRILFELSAVCLLLAISNSYNMSKIT